MTTKIHPFKKETKDTWFNNLSQVNRDIYDILEKSKKEGKNVVISITTTISDEEIEEIEKYYVN